MKIVLDPALRRGDIPNFSYTHFRKASSRFVKWATCYLESQRAAAVQHENCAATEWPMFGSVYYLLAAEEMQNLLGNKNDPAVNKARVILQKAAKAAAIIVADPKTGSWTKQKWGESYRSKENAFYRMLLIMGLSSYENITRDEKYLSLLQEQATSLGSELMNASSHMLNDYPGECYPNDVLWAVAAILRADHIIGTDHSSLKTGLLRSINTCSLTGEKVPAYAVDAESACPITVARGCANSGILVFTPELDFETARNWYAQHERHFWQSNNLCAGFREFTRDYPNPSVDVDTGPIVAGYGSVASIFGIGAARAMGRLDHSVPLTMEAIALSWPTPFGFMLPSIMAYYGARSSCLGEVAMLFLMTRPVLADAVTPFTGKVPGIVWLSCAMYFGCGIIFLLLEYRYWRRWSQKGQRVNCKGHFGHFLV